MNKKKWFYISICLSVFLILAVIMFLYTSHFFVAAKETSLQEYLELSPENNYLPAEGYIPDARTAAKMGTAIIDKMCDKGFLDCGFVTVEYDSQNRLWKVNKSYLFHSGGFVIIEQNTGEIVKALLNK